MLAFLLSHCREIVNSLKQESILEMLGVEKNHTTPTIAWEVVFFFTWGHTAGAVIGRVLRRSWTLSDSGIGMQIVVKMFHFPLRGALRMRDSWLSWLSKRQAIWCERHHSLWCQALSHSLIGSDGQASRIIDNAQKVAKWGTVLGRIHQIAIAE